MKIQSAHQQKGKFWIKINLFIFNFCIRRFRKNSIWTNQICNKYFTYIAILFKKRPILEEGTIWDRANVVVGNNVWNDETWNRFWRKKKKTEIKKRKKKVWGMKEPRDFFFKFSPDSFWTGNGQIVAETLQRINCKSFNQFLKDSFLIWFN